MRKVLRNFGIKDKVLLNLRFGLCIAVSLALGIGFACYIFSQAVFSAILSAISFILFTAFYVGYGFKKQVKFERVIVLVIFILTFLLGTCSLAHTIKSYNNADLNNHYVTVTGKVKAIEETDNGVTVVLNKVDLSITSNKVKYNVKVYVSGNLSLELGDKITFSDYLYDKDVFFDSRISSYDISSKIKWQAYVSSDQIEILESSPNIFQKINIFIKNTLKDGLDNEEFSVAYALLTGDSNLIEEDVITDFRKAGVAHVFAVSGLHIGFLATAIGFILGKLKVDKRIKIFILIACLFTYSGVCGFSASSLRAGIMCSIASVLKLFGKRYDGLNAVGIAGFIILLFSPLQMLCAGFVLSFGVVLGILIMQNPLERLLKFLPSKLASSLALVISAQLTSIPISIAFFGNFSIISVLANLIFVPLVAFVFYTLLAGVVVGGLLTIPVLSLFISGILLKALIFIITVLDYDIFIISGIYLGGFAVIYYLAIFIASGMVNLKALTRRVVSLILITVCAFSSLFYSICQYRTTRLYVASTNSFSATLVNGENSVLIVSYATMNASLYPIGRLDNKLGLDMIDSVIFSSGVSIVNVQNLITGLNYYFDVQSVYYYGERDENLEKVIEKSFPKVEVANYLDGVLRYNAISFESIEQGKAFIVESSNKKALVFAKHNSAIPITDVKGDKFDLIVTANHCLDIERYYAPKKIYCYSECDRHLNAINGGNLSFVLK